MKITNKISCLLFTLVGVIVLPWLGSCIFYHGHFRPGFFAYPPYSAGAKKGFNIYIFSAMALVCAVICAVYIFPQWFGFKKPVEAPVAKPKVKLPLWFWIGLLAWGSVMVLFCTKAQNPAWYINWSDLPLFWGFTLMLDGWVYVRNGGSSLVSKVPQELIGVGVFSISGWMIFEFLNFFVDKNWYYPRGYIFGREEFLLYACLISSGLMPLAFEWYCVFKTFPKLSKRFSNGIKLKLPRMAENIAFVICVLGIFGSGLFPDYLFFFLWLSPTFILVIVLHRLGIWTPIKPISQGNWSPALLSALTYLITGFFLEGQNYLCATHTDPLWTAVPAYWQYSLPYVNVLHVFEMPLLGFFGYLPFGIYCWLWWIVWGTLLNIPSPLLNEDPL